MPATIGGLIGGAFAVIGMIVNGRREGKKTKNERIREYVRGVGQCLLAIEDLYGQYHEPDRWSELNDEGRVRQDRLLRELGMYVASLPENSLRAPLELVAGLIGHPGIGTFTGEQDSSSTRNLCAYGIDVVTKHLRGEALPAQPAFIGEYLGARRDQEAIWQEEDERRRRQ